MWVCFNSDTQVWESIIYKNGKPEQLLVNSARISILLMWVCFNSDTQVLESIIYKNGKPEQLLVNIACINIAFFVFNIF